MAYILAICFLSLDTQDLSVKVVSQKVAETDHHYLDSVVALHLWEQYIFAVDYQSLTIFRWNMENDEILSFSGRGEAPNELQKPVVSLYFQDNALHVIHAGGKRASIFSPDGDSLYDERLTDSKAIYYQGREAVICEEKDLLFSGSDFEFHAEAFDQSKFGFSKVACKSDSAFLIATETSNTDDFAVRLFGLKPPYEITSQLIEKQKKNYDRPMPKKVQIMLKESGAPLSSMFLTAIFPPINMEDGSFSIVEFSIHKDQTTNSVSVMHILFPNKKEQTILRITHNKDFHPSFFTKYKNLWAFFDGSKNTFGLAEFVEK